MSSGSKVLSEFRKSQKAELYAVSAWLVSVGEGRDLVRRVRGGRLLRGGRGGGDSVRGGHLERGGRRDERYNVHAGATGLLLDGGRVDAVGLRRRHLRAVGGLVRVHAVRRRLLSAVDGSRHLRGV